MNRSMLKNLVLVFAGVLLLQSTALAGPPLLCHPFNIGDARSLPFQGPDWSRVDASYDIKHLVDDTAALLNADTPVIVRMETLRRATVYSRNNPQIAALLFDRLKTRADAIKPDRRDREALLAWFDLGYLAETYKQAAKISQSVSPHDQSFWSFQQTAPELDGYALIKKAIAGGGGAEMEFAGAVIASSQRGGNYYDHLHNAAAGAKPGSLLAQNLASHFADDLRSARLAGK